MKRANKKKSYKELRADPVIGIPIVAWILDRKVFYLAVVVVGCVLAGGFVYQGWKAYGQVIAPAEKESPYLAIDPAQSAGVKWAADLVREPHGIEGWEVKDSSQPSHGFIQDATGNTAGEVPITLLATKVASAGPTKSVVQVYGAGQARRQYDLYVEKLAARGPVENTQVTDSGIFGAKFPQGFIMVAGDSIVGIQTTDNETRDNLLGEYLASVEETLPLSGCVDISATDSSKRSLYFDPNTFEGLQETRTIEPEVNTNYLPTVQGIGAKEVANPYAAVPEAPLPASLPGLPAEVAKPTIENAPAAMDDFSGIASYRVQDPIGPGCGWTWSAQNPLEYDDADLKITKEDTVTKVQNDVNSKAQTYVDSRVTWARIMALISPSLDSWNRYVDGVNSVHGRWDKLVADRAALRPAWDQYLAAHDSWSTFDSRKAAADKSYNEAVTQCLADRKTHAEWELEWGTEALKKKQAEWKKKQEEAVAKPIPTPAPTPAPTVPPMPTAPPEPKDCKTDPERPSILDEQKPAKPEAPAIPEDVTIPDSWPKPQG